jgi:hypothetical protein
MANPPTTILFERAAASLAKKRRNTTRRPPARRLCHDDDFSLSLDQWFVEKRVRPPATVVCRSVRPSVFLSWAWSPRSSSKQQAGNDLLRRPRAASRPRPSDSLMIGPGPDQFGKSSRPGGGGSSGPTSFAKRTRPSSSRTSKRHTVKPPPPGPKPTRSTSTPLFLSHPVLVPLPLVNRNARLAAGCGCGCRLAADVPSARADAMRSPSARTTTGGGVCDRWVGGLSIVGGRASLHGMREVVVLGRWFTQSFFRPRESPSGLGRGNHTRKTAIRNWINQPGPCGRSHVCVLKLASLKSPTARSNQSTNLAEGSLIIPLPPLLDDVLLLLSRPPTRPPPLSNPHTTRCHG